MSDDPPNGENDRVGYGRPPKHSRFKPGNPGNPTGRGKRQREDFAKTISAIHASRVEIRQGGKSRTVTLPEANIEMLFAKAKRGDVGAALRLMDIRESKTRTSAQAPKVIEIYDALPDDESDQVNAPTPENGSSAPPRSDDN